MQAPTPQLPAPAGLLRPISVLTALVLLGIVTASFAMRSEPAIQAEPQAPVAVFLVRHAETQASTLEARDPDLSDAGHARAAALRQLLAATGVTHLFTSPYERTRQMVAPLAERYELNATEYDPGQLAELARRLRALPPGSKAVVAGHSNTTPGLAFELCGTWPGRLETDERGGHNLPHDAYERLYLIQLPADPDTGAGANSLLELTLPAGD